MFVVRLSNTWAEIREADTNLKKVNTQMLIKTTKTQRRYEIVGYDVDGEAIRRLAKDPKIVPTNVRVTQTAVVGGQVTGIVNVRELYYNPWALPLGSLYPGDFKEIPANLHPMFRDTKLMEQLFPSFMSIKDTA